MHEVRRSKILLNINGIQLTFVGGLNSYFEVWNKSHIEDRVFPHRYFFCLTG
jgi:hypothetical protein